MAQAVNPEGRSRKRGAPRRHADADEGRSEEDRRDRRSWLAHMRGDARASAADLLGGWLADWRAARLRHTPASFTALVQVCGSGA